MSLSVVYITEAGPVAGLGHLRRCQALATALRRRGASARFLIDGATDVAGPDAMYLDWTQEPMTVCAPVAAWHPDAVVVDSYLATPELLSRLRATGCVIAIDDLADRPVPVHVVVNGAFHAARLSYRCAADTKLLLGPEYSLVDPAFAASPDGVPAEIVGRVLVTLGGSATASALATAVAAVRRAVPSATVDVALGLYADDVPDDGGLVIAHRGQRSLRELIRRADLAVTAGGMTLYECLATGTPAVGLCCADNQRLNIEALSRAGLVVSAEPSLEGAVRRLAADRELRWRMAAEGRRHVDGRGAERVAEAVAQVCSIAGAGRDAR